MQATWSPDSGTYTLLLQPRHTYLLVPSRPVTISVLSPTPTNPPFVLILKLTCPMFTTSAIVCILHYETTEKSPDMSTPRCATRACLPSLTHVVTEPRSQGLRGLFSNKLLKTGQPPMFGVGIPSHPPTTDLKLATMSSWDAAYQTDFRNSEGNMEASMTVADPARIHRSHSPHVAPSSRFQTTPFLVIENPSGRTRQAHSP